MKVIEPEVGNWYQSALTRQTFEVVALDDHDNTVEIQYFDGDVAELDLDSWYRLELDNIPEPEDWTGPYEMEGDDIGGETENYHPNNWDPLAHFDPDRDD